jgi:hypothetical protein
MGTELCVKCAAAGIVGERDLDDDQPRLARCAGPVVLDVLSRRTAICIACTMRLRNETPRMLIGRPKAGNSNDERSSDSKTAASDGAVGMLRAKRASVPGLT